MKRLLLLCLFIASTAGADDGEWESGIAYERQLRTGYVAGGYIHVWLRIPAPQQTAKGVRYMKVLRAMSCNPNSYIDLERVFVFADGHELMKPGNGETVVPDYATGADLEIDLACGKTQQLLSKMKK